MIQSGQFPGQFPVNGVVTLMLNYTGKDSLHNGEGIGDVPS